MGKSTGVIRGRRAASNPDNRFDSYGREAVDDGWGEPEPAPKLATTLTADKSRSVISRNDSPDVCFRQSINPYGGCEHGCIYCYARPSHAWLGFSPGFDFETRLIHKPDAPPCLIAQRFGLATRRFGYLPEPRPLETGLFSPPGRPQLSLF